MQSIQDLVRKIGETHAEIVTIVEEINNSKLTYNKAKDIRKLAQKLKIMYQDLRTTTLEVYKAK